MTVDHKAIKKILVLRYRSIGDIVLSFPAMEALRNTFPDARIDLVIDEGFEDICYVHPYVDYLILNKRKKKKMSRYARFMDELKFVAKVRKVKYDLVVDLHCGPRSSWLAFLSGAKYRLGNPLRLRNRLFYNVHSEPAPDTPHSIDVMLNIIRPLRPAMPSNRSLFLAYKEDDKSYVKNFLHRYEVIERDIVVMIHPGARVDIKRLPAEKMGDIVKWLTTEVGAKVILAGSDRDITPISDIAVAAGQPCLMATNLTLGQLAALMDSCDLFIGNDSGPMHMAAALGVPIVAFFGPSDPAIWGPASASAKVIRAPKMECMPCDQKNCPYVGQHCMTKISAATAKRVIGGVLRHGKTPVISG